MGLQWVEADEGRSWDGVAVDGLRYAYVVASNVGYAVFIEPRGCPHDGGLHLGGGPVYATAEDAMEAADSYVVAHVDATGHLEPAPHERSSADDGERSPAAVEGHVIGRLAGPPAG